MAFRDAPNMLFHNEGDRFVDVAKDVGVDDPRKTVGAVWFDYNLDGRLDLFVANQDGTLNGFFRNDGNRFVDVAHEQRHSLSVPECVAGGVCAALPASAGARPARAPRKADSEVRLYAPGGRTVWGGRVVDTGSGYCSQNAMPLHFGLPKDGRVDVEVTAMTKAGRKITRIANVDPHKLQRRTLVVKIAAS